MVEKRTELAIANDTYYKKYKEQCPDSISFLLEFLFSC